MSPKKVRPEIASAKKKMLQNTEIHFMKEALGKLDDLTTRATSNKDDAYDHFVGMLHQCSILLDHLMRCCSSSR